MPQDRINRHRRAHNWELCAQLGADFDRIDARQAAQWSKNCAHNLCASRQRPIRGNRAIAHSRQNHPDSGGEEYPGGLRLSPARSTGGCPTHWPIRPAHPRSSRGHAASARGGVPPTVRRVMPPARSAIPWARSIRRRRPPAQPAGRGPHPPVPPGGVRAAGERARKSLRSAA